MHSSILPEWNHHYPDPEMLRDEINHMADSFVEVLLDDIPSQEIRGIYLKGSAQKEWDTPVDYVPELSDVGIHIKFYSDALWPQYVGTVPQAMAIQRKVESLYLSKVAHPVHTPRPQLLVVNKIVDEIEFVESPRCTVRVLYGEGYPTADYSNPNHIRRGDCNRLTNDAAYLADFPLEIIDKPGKWLWVALRSLVFRISPAAPRVLHISGVDTETAWSVNRTRAVSMLRELGQPELAGHYSEFYLSGWEYFLSRYESTDAGRSAIGAGVEFLTKAGEIANNWLADHPAS